ncbi:hypothetical protein GobsT_34640 [Gemmata obscuriglobus]|uniref:Uncharacterized protein n=1 Tax=Gemmata obscuriglobus TaxID=114 RepID=A0A2Z3HB14_9BACT|nr:hypothetical protein [Gemmata obscuriglobus]AWM38400.1 hypothetical protein C1280_16315 [Gemmata obscuriglobus]QEG28678.1 hypothetical protein GobsT_34640 [Gemmata obscuriglobus]VTS06920.1 unnamed protein product [Gemmata obscuriglobus UQM 2246]
MLTFVVTLRGGRRYTIRAAEMRFGYDGALELLGFAPPTDAEPFPGKQAVALFSAGEVESVVAREFLVSEEPSEPKPCVVQPNSDPIPF